jgi:hypothetical protein
MCELISWSDEMDGRKSGWRVRCRRRYGFAARMNNLWRRMPPILQVKLVERRAPTFFSLVYGQKSPFSHLDGQASVWRSPWRMGSPAVPKVKREPKSWKYRRTHAGILNIDIIHLLPAISANPAGDEQRKIIWDASFRVHNNSTRM